MRNNVRPMPPAEKYQLSDWIGLAIAVVLFMAFVFFCVDIGSR